MSPTTRTVVKIATFEVLKAEAGTIVTHALGSCIGLTVFDPLAQVGGMLHFMLPAPNPGAATPSNLGPHAFASTAVPELFRAVYALGGDKKRLIVCAAGGAETLQAGSAMKIGPRNWTMLRKLLWRNNVAIAASDVAGQVSRNLSLDLCNGTVTVSKDGQSEVLWRPAA